MKPTLKLDKIRLKPKKSAMLDKKIKLWPTINLLKQKKEDTDDRLPESD